MGDRANIVIRGEWKGSKDAPDLTSHEGTFLYGHWSGYDLPENLRGALAGAEDRWDDPQYLARILFDQALSHDPNGHTGFGISTRLGDNEYDLLVLFPMEKLLVRIPETAYHAAGLDRADHPSISFADYVAADERTWDNLTDVVSLSSPSSDAPNQEDR